MLVPLNCRSRLNGTEMDPLSFWWDVGRYHPEGLRTGSDLILIRVDAFLMGASGT